MINCLYGHSGASGKCQSCSRLATSVASYEESELSRAGPHSEETRRQYCFGAFTLDLESGLLCRGGEEIALRPKSFEVLAYLVERHGRLVSREELMSALWPDVTVTDESVTKCIADIRRALGDDSQQSIRTVARRGYLFMALLTAPVVEFPRQPISAEIAGGPVPAPSGDAANRFRGRRILISIVSAAVALLPAALLLISRTSPRSREPTYAQITNFTDSAFSPALSPDGRLLAFIRGRNVGTLGGEGDIYIKLLPDGEPVQLTHDGKTKMTPVFTPTGDHVAYAVPGIMTDPMSWSTWTVPVFGGEPKLLLSNASALSWIPGVSPPRVLFSQVDMGVHMSIVISSENRTEARTVYSPVALSGMAHRSFVSPDHQHVLIVEMQGRGWEPCRLAPFEPHGQAEPMSGAGRPTGPSPGQCSSAAWSPDGKWVYFSVNTGDGYHIWRQRFPNGMPQQVTFGATEEQEIAFAPDARSFFTSAGIRQSTLWIHDARGERQITSEGYACLPRFSPDGKKLYFLLRSRANRRFVSGELWAADLETGQRERLLPEFLLEDYGISPDGTRIVFVAIAPSGDGQVWLSGLDRRGAPRLLSNMDANRAFFGPSGEVFFKGADGPGKRFLYRVREDGRNLQKAIPNPIIEAYGSAPDGKAVAAWSGTAVQVVPTDGSSPTNASMVCAAAGGENRGTTPPCVSWSANGKYLYLNDRPAGQIYALPIPRGRNLPPLPAGGIASAIEAEAVPGARVIHERYAFVGGDPSVYAFFRVTTQRNIYRISVP
jgi:DNA-binding winged helix-turn-helix (wHTH) protein/Tol biopolymer transport system component